MLILAQPLTFKYCFLLREVLDQELSWQTIFHGSYWTEWLLWWLTAQICKATVFIWTLILHRWMYTYSCDTVGIYMYDCPRHASRPFTGLKTIVPLQQPDLKNPATVEHLENIKPEEWNSCETAFFYVVTGGEGKDRERYRFVFIEQKTKGSSKNLKITAQLEERDIIFVPYMTSNIFPNFSIDCLYRPQLMNGQHLHANILLSHILYVSCIYLTCVLCCEKYTMQTRSVLCYSDRNTTVQASMQR